MLSQVCWFSPSVFHASADNPNAPGDRMEQTIILLETFEIK